MDATTDAIAGFVDSLDLKALTDSALHEAKRRLIDTLGCALGGLDSPPAQIARSLAADTRGTNKSATAIGLDDPTSVELAAFANTVMVRYLDYNDMHFTATGGGGHPSDLLPTALAVGEATGASGLETLLAAVIAYEVNGAIAGGVWLRRRGWDQGLHVVIASAMAAGKLLGLSREQLGHAVSLAATPNVPVRQTRVGELSMWKGCATAGAARNGVFAALLAQKGMTGPPEPFEGRDGIWEQVTGPFEITIPTQADRFVIENVATKTHPAEYNAQGPLDLIADLRDQIEVGEIDQIDVETYFLAYDEIGSEAQKWDPQTRETADHSLPYLLAVALVDGDISAASFTRDRILDPELRPLMQRIRIQENPDFTARFPAEINCRISIRHNSGEMVSGHLLHPRGHPLNQVTDAELNDKFDSLAHAYRHSSETAVCDELRDSIWDLDRIDDIKSLMEPLRQLSTS